MKLLHSLPYTKEGVVHPVGRMTVPKSLVSTMKASLLSGMPEVELRLTPDVIKTEGMPVHLPTLGVVGVAVYADGDDRVVKLYQE